jgi:hypothetical protein
MVESGLAGGLSAWVSGLAPKRAKTASKKVRKRPEKRLRMFIRSSLCNLG